MILLLQRFTTVVPQKAKKRYLFNAFWGRLMATTLDSGIRKSGVANRQNIKPKIKKGCMKMEKAICFGAGGTAKHLFNKISEKYEVLAFVDNQESRHGQKWLGKEIIAPDKIRDYPYDYIIITSLMGEAISNQLVGMGVDKSRIITSFISYPVESRIAWLHSLSELQKNIDPSIEVAEVGVFQGDFAKYINSFYPDRILHLFDTFEGFSEKDIEQEKGLSSACSGHLAATSEEIVTSKLKYPKNVFIHKGYFPQTAEGITSQFCYVNLDLDLYLPTLEGLRFFVPKMVKGGVITIHDYLWGAYEKSIKKAVHEFMDETEFKNLRLMPIGDKISIAVVGF